MNIMKKSREQKISDVQEHILKGNLNSAELIAIKLSSDYPKDIVVKQVLSFVQLKLNKIKDAVKTLNQAISIQPNESTNYYNLANIYEKEGMNTEAIHCYLKTISINKGDFLSKKRLAEIYFRENHLNKALEIYEELLMQDEFKDNIKLLGQKAVCIGILDNPENAKIFIDKHLMSHTNKDEAKSMIVLVYHYIGFKKEALEISKELEGSIIFSQEEKVKIS